MKVVANPESLTCKSPLLYRFVGLSRKPFSHFVQQIRVPANPVQISVLRGCYSYSLNYGHGTGFKALGGSKMGFGKLGCDCVRVSATGDGGSGGAFAGGGAFGGSGDGNSGSGRSEGGGTNWSFLSWYLALLAKFPLSAKGVTSAILTCIGDLIGQLVIDQVPTLNLKRTFPFILWGLVLVGPILFWLETNFLAFDVSLFLHIGMTLIFLFAIRCCILLVAIAYAVATRQCASEDEIKSLPKYRYRLASPLRTLDNGERQDAFDTGLESGNSSNELALYLEDSDCCICLSQYVDGAELYKLPCNHHFHCGCISKWLRINATCPICKINITVN